MDFVSVENVASKGTYIVCNVILDLLIRYFPDTIHAYFLIYINEVVLFRR